MSETTAEPVVNKHAMALGEAGVKYTLGQVAAMAAAARNHPEVVAFARRLVRDSGCDANDDVAVAKAIYDGLLAKGIRWLKDPARTEFIAAAHHFVPSVDDAGQYRDDALMVSADCDELSLLSAGLFLACTEAVGVESAAILGHSYAKQRQFQHVLYAIWDGRKGQNRWIRIDPSSNREFGYFRPDYTREIMIAVPSCRIICDADSCASGPRAVKPPPLMASGEFVGLSGAEDMQTQETTPDVFISLGDARALEPEAFVSLGDAQAVADETASVWYALMARNADDADATLRRLEDDHDKMIAIFGVLGVDPLNNPYGWGPEEEDAYQTILIGGRFIALAFRQAATGERQLVMVPENNTYILAAMPDDPIAVDVADGVFAIVKSLAFEIIDGAIAEIEATDFGVGAVPATPVVIVGGVVAVALIAAGYFSWAKFCELMGIRSREATQQGLTDLTAQCAQNYDPERCSALVAQVGVAGSSRDREERKKADADLEKTKIVVGVGVGVVGLVLGGLGVRHLVNKRKARA